MNSQERLDRALSVLTREPMSTSKLKELAGLRGNRDPVYSILMAAARRGEVIYHGKDKRGECLWSREGAPR